MTTDDAFLQAIFEKPDDLVLRAVYADWLEEHGDPRAEFLRLLLELKTNPARRIQERLATLRPAVGRKWASLLEIFDGRIRETETVWLTIRTNSHGIRPSWKNIVRVSPPGALLLMREGWRYIGLDGNSWYVAAPGGVDKKNPTFLVEIPTKQEIERLALECHRRGNPRQSLSFGPWRASYRQPGRSWALAEFEFGTRAPWTAYLTWDKSLDLPPRVAFFEMYVKPWVPG